MTVSVDKNRIEYTGNGSTTVFAYDFLVLDQAHLQVYLNAVLKTISTHYTVSGVGEGGGGSVTFLVAPGSGVKVTILRVAPITQAVDYQTGGKFPAETHEEALDKLTMITQQISEQLGRQPALSVESTFEDLTLPDPVAAKLIRWKADQTGFENVSATDIGLGDGTVVTSEGDLIQGGTGGVVERLAVGSAGQGLQVSGGKAAWVTRDHGTLAGLADDDHTQYTQKATLTTKGDVYAATAASTPARVGAGANRTILEADSAQTAGVIFAARALGLKSVQVFTSSDTWTRPTGIRKVVVEVIGAGGGGGGLQQGVDTASGGGGAGGFAQSLLDVTAIATSTIAVGGGGAGGAGGGGNPGTTGGNSSWTDGTNTVTGVGGAGGSGATAGTNANGGIGGTASGGNITRTGNGGHPGINTSSIPAGGKGGAGPHGGAGNGGFGGGGGAGEAYGSGGGGAGDDNTSNRAGGNGANGVVIVWEYE